MRKWEKGKLIDLSMPLWSQGSRTKWEKMLGDPCSDPQLKNKSNFRRRLNQIREMALVLRGHQAFSLPLYPFPQSKVWTLCSCYFLEHDDAHSSKSPLPGWTTVLAIPLDEQYLMQRCSEVEGLGVKPLPERGIRRSPNHSQHLNKLQLPEFLGGKPWLLKVAS